jgi:hypothetical protein
VFLATQGVIGCADFLGVEGSDMTFWHTLQPWAMWHATLLSNVLDLQPSRTLKHEVPVWCVHCTLLQASAVAETCQEIIHD